MVVAAAAAPKIGAALRPLLDLCRPPGARLDLLARHRLADHPADAALASRTPAVLHLRRHGIADAAAHAIDDIAAIWKPHDLGGAQQVRRKVQRPQASGDRREGPASHLSVIPFVGLMAYSYTLLTPHIEDRLFGSDAGQGAVFWNFISQSIMGGTDVFGFFLSQDTKASCSRTCTSPNSSRNPSKPAPSSPASSSTAS